MKPLFVVAALAAAGLLHEEGAAGPSDDLRAAFDDIHRTVAEHFFDEELNGLDWEAIGREAAPRAAAAGSLEAFGAIVNEMLARLGASHTHFYTAREPAYYQLLAIFRRPMGEAIGAAHPDNASLAYAGIAFFTKRIGEEVFVSGVLEGGPAAAAGLRVGDRIVSVNGAPFHPIGSFEGRADTPVAIAVQRTRDGTHRTVEVTPVMIDPGTMFVKAMQESIRIVERASLRIGYVHAWSYAGEPYQELLKESIAFGALRDADALVLDLRDGWGGANPEDLNLFNRRVPTMTHITRDGERRLIDFQWRKPVALLVNGGSRSGKEALAYGFQKHRVGPVVGARTAGAVVGGRPFLIRPGMLLYLAVIDVRVDDERLEGRGVTPDVVVPFELPYADGADPQLEAALDVLESVLEEGGRSPER